MLIATIMEATTLQSILTSIGSIFTAFVGYVGDVCEAVASQPLLLLGVSIPITFAVVTFVRKLFNF